VIRSVLVAHRHRMVAEGLTAALSRFEEIVVQPPVTTALDLDLALGRVHAVGLDRGLPGAESTANRLRRAGARVVFLEDEAPEDGTAADDEAGERGVSVSLTSPVPVLAAALVPGLRTRGSSRPLTDREGQVIMLASEGMSCKQIARHLGISPKTVEQHKTRAFTKLGVPNQAAAVRVLLSTAQARG